MLPKTDWADLIPHQGGMCLLDQVVRYDAGTIEALTESHRDPENPLRRDGRLHAVHLCEYGAQAMAVHGALLARATGERARPGLLVSLRKVQFAVERIDDIEGALTIHAERLSGDDDAWLCAFTVRQGQRQLASGRAMVLLQAAD